MLGCPNDRPQGGGRRAGYPPQREQELALSNQRRVSSSVQPGTAKRAGVTDGFALGLGSTMTFRGARMCGTGLE
jgi:hypothetical protein